MVIKKLTIYNFRSYYGTKVFEFSDHLNLILGSNGDGKTTFFDAINWVLTPDYVQKTEDDKLEESSLVSAKMFSELKAGESGRVLVSMTLRNNSGSTRIIERAFNVMKAPDGKMRIDGRTHKAYQLLGSIRKEMFSVKDVFEKEGAFPAIIKKYHIFKGEDRLNIFNDKTTLQALIDMFSEVKDLEPFKQFAKYAKETVGIAVFIPTQYAGAFVHDKSNNLCLLKQEKKRYFLDRKKLFYTHYTAHFYLTCCGATKENHPVASSATEWFAYLRRWAAKLR